MVIDTASTFELVPVLGNQKIVFGDTSDMKNKLDNLFAFYKNVLNRIGWDKYEVLDLRYKNQVIATPSLPYKGPIDKSVAGMNWINSIVATEAKNEALDSAKGDDEDSVVVKQPIKPIEKIKIISKKDKEAKRAIKKNKNYLYKGDSKKGKTKEALKKDKKAKAPPPKKAVHGKQKQKE